MVGRHFELAMRSSLQAAQDHFERGLAAYEKAGRPGCAACTRKRRGGDEIGALALEPRPGTVPAIAVFETELGGHPFEQLNLLGIAGDQQLAGPVEVEILGRRVTVEGVARVHRDVLSAAEK